MYSKMVPHRFNYDTTESQGGLTSATTAIGNQDGISHENRSGHSGHEISRGGQHNGVFGGDVSHKSISDHEKNTPKNQQCVQDGFSSIVASINQQVKKEGEDQMDKPKDPYYFTFFNEKNEASQKEEKKMPTKPQIKIKTKKSALNNHTNADNF